MRTLRSSENSVSVKANAKINLYLDITGKREDGYHLLETVMHTVSLHDDIILTLCANPEIYISCTDSRVPCGRENIAFKAAEAFFSLTGIKNPGLRINIVKRIPSQAGLGGGSADGAAVICGLNELFGTQLPLSELMSAAASTGADVPFCILGGAAYCTGIGEIMTVLPKLKGYAVIAQGCSGISTPEAFAKIDGMGGIGLCGVYDFYDSKPELDTLGGFCRNIFEDLSSDKEILTLKRKMLENKALCACMSGSGSAVYGLFSDKTAAIHCAEAVSDGCSFAGVYELV